MESSTKTEARTETRAGRHLVQSEQNIRPRFFWSAHRAPLHPGNFLESRFLHPSGISQEKLAKALNISRRRVNELVGGKRGITPDTAVKLANFFGTDVAFWLELQFAWDIYQARQMYYASNTNITSGPQSGK